MVLTRNGAPLFELTTATCDLHCLNIPLVAWDKHWERLGYQAESARERHICVARLYLRREVQDSAVVRHRGVAEGRGGREQIRRARLPVLPALRLVCPARRWRCKRGGRLAGRQTDRQTDRKKKKKEGLLVGISSRYLPSDNT